MSSRSWVPLLELRKKVEEYLVHVEKWNDIFCMAKDRETCFYRRLNDPEKNPKQEAWYACMLPTIDLSAPNMSRHFKEEKHRLIAKVDKGKIVSVRDFSCEKNRKDNKKKVQEECITTYALHECPYVIGFFIQKGLLEKKLSLSYQVLTKWKDVGDGWKGRHLMVKDHIYYEIKDPLCRRHTILSDSTIASETLSKMAKEGKVLWKLFVGDKVKKDLRGVHNYGFHKVLKDNAKDLLRKRFPVIKTDEQRIRYQRAYVIKKSRGKTKNSFQIKKVE